MNPLSLLLPAALLAGAARAQEASLVRRDTLEVQVRVSGTVIAEDMFRLKSSIDGRVEAVMASTGAWNTPDQDLALMASRELTALIDAQGTTRRDILEDRWKKVWKPTPIRCPDACFILKSFVRKKLWVKPQSILFEAARTLRMVGKVGPEDSHWISNGQQLSFWPAQDPKRRLSARIAHYSLDAQSEKTASGGTFTMEMPPEHWLPPGTQWEGTITPLVKKNVLLAPTSALIRLGPDVFLPVRVSTGITTKTLTEITAGIEENRKILILDDAGLKEASRHRQETDFKAFQRRLRENNPAAPPSAPKPKELPKSGRFSEIHDPDASSGEDPDAE